MTQTRRVALAATIFAILSVPALAQGGLVPEGCATGQSFSTGPVTVSGAYLRATPPGAKAAGAYLTLTNTGTESDTLLGATSEAAAEIAVHSMSMNNGVMEMAPVEGGLPIPPGGSVALEPKGFHLMLTGMDQPFVEGACVQMVLHFEKSGDLPIELNVGGFAQNAPPDGTGATPAPMDHDMGDISGMESMEGM
ncbi:MAG TPA: copper chaperone PCu(A)C [Devosia sp.]|nr:copper chaperone PCu(A)C [Devosia sp.]